MTAPGQPVDLEALRPTHDEVEAEARRLWEVLGRPQGQDAQIWEHAESKLLVERYRGLARRR